MKRSVKIWLAVGGCLLIAGLALIGASAARGGWDFASLDNGNYGTVTYDVNDVSSLRGIKIDTDTDDIAVLPSQDGRARVVIFEEEKEKHTVGTDGGILEIAVVKEKKTSSFLDFSFRQTKVTVYLPKGEYGYLTVKESTGDVEVSEGFTFESIDISASTGDVSCRASASGNIGIALSTGDITLDGVSAKSIALAVSTGRIDLSNVSCKGETAITVSTGKTFLKSVTCASFTTGGSTGDVTLSDVVAEGVMSVTRSTGDVRLDGCDAAEISIKTDTGDVTGTLLSSKVFMTKTDTGSVDVPETVSGGKCRIVTDTGDIKIKLK